MKIRRLRTYLVPPRWLFLRIDTDEGLVGWGEPVVEGRAHTVATAVGELADYLVGRDPLLIEDHWQALTKGGFYRGGPVLSSAVAGIDQALWDIAGKALEAPVHALLGGPVRDRVRMYTWFGGDDPGAITETALEHVAAGFTALKMNACGRLAFVDTPAMTQAIVDRVAVIRDALGQACDLAVDFHGRVSTPMARRLLRELEAFDLLFVEEALLPEHGDGYGQLAASTCVPLATGERLYSRWDFKSLLGSGVAVLQPDPSHAGGISEVRRIAAMAEAWDMAVAPHCPLGPIALAAALQLAFATPNHLIQEQSIGIHYNEEADLLDYVLEPSVFDLRDGYVERLNGPGLGIEIDVAAVERAAGIGHRWRPPIWRHPDGSLAEW